MGLKEEFQKFFTDKKKEPVINDKLDRLGLDIISDRKLDERMSLINDLHDELEKPIKTDDVIKRIQILRDRLQMVNHAMKIVSVPWGRAGDQTNYRLAMKGWETLYSVAMDVINTVDRMVKAASDTENVENSTENVTDKLLATAFKINVSELERKLESFLQIEVFPYSFLIMDSSYYDKDLAPRHVTTIQNYQPQQRYIPFGYEQGYGPKKKEQ